MPNVYVGRQPIFDRDLGVIAYELLYRSGVNGNAAGAVCGEQASKQTIVNTFLEIGLDRLVGNRPAAINLTEDFFVEADKLPFAPGQVILEVLEDIPVTPRLIEGIEHLSNAGFTIALDDYLYSPSHAPLLKLADIVKIDLMRLDRDQLAEHVRVLRQYPVELVAEKVETEEEFNYCKSLGFDYFQGYFLSRPQVIEGESLPNNRLAVLNLLAVLHDASADAEDLADAINADVALSYKMLKLINSAAFNLPRKIESIHRGVLLLGRRKLASWASMIALNAMTDRPSELLRMAMTRAKMCELLAEKAGLSPLESYFTVGLFSALDLLMQRPLDSLVKPLPLSEEVMTALLERQGQLGEALVCALAYELGDFESCRFADLSTDDVVIANIEAVTWAGAILDSL